MIDAQRLVSFRNGLVPGSFIGAGSPLVGGVIGDWGWPLLFNLFLGWSHVLESGVSPKSFDFLWGFLFLVVFKCCESGIHWAVGSGGRFPTIAFGITHRFLFVFLQPIFVLGLVQPHFLDAIMRVMCSGPRRPISQILDVFEIEAFLTWSKLLLTQKLDLRILFLEGFLKTVSTDPRFLPILLFNLNLIQKAVFAEFWVHMAMLRYFDGLRTLPRFIAAMLIGARDRLPHFFRVIHK